ncbi:hypothetical protein [cyanobacterium endosymbiont of Epithemia clementina EcSB]|nr:hypothetical protein [cyanobacterium endosymbiont of Epithemia clementina EcSB]WGT66772.1 hypothetical protein P3F56_05800 [cyanobacterium endosymbiont of Epithemia clementina EcSB]
MVAADVSLAHPSTTLTQDFYRSQSYYPIVKVMLEIMLIDILAFWRRC